MDADEIAEIMTDVRSDIRLRATARHDTNARKAARFQCPVCFGRLYPRAPAQPGYRYYWSHLPGAACPLEIKRRLTPDQINARIFAGRQEGEAHRALVALLLGLAESDPSVSAGSVLKGEYEPPTPEMRTEFSFGRFPDVQFLLGDLKVILEAQLATITLHGINGRRAFYDRSGARLLWIMRNFDPSGPLRASIRDIIADQAGVLFSLDPEVEARCHREERLLLRAWKCTDDGDWSNSIVHISEAAAVAKQKAWADAFKERWVLAYRGRGFYDVEGPDPWAMFDEITERAGLAPPQFPHDDASPCLLDLVRTLISLEAGFVTGSRHLKLVSLANSFNVHGGHRAANLIRKALERWQPALLKIASVRHAFEHAKTMMEKNKEAPWGRNSPIGRIRDVLFPEWRLDNNEEVIPSSCGEPVRLC